MRDLRFTDWVFVVAAAAVVVAGGLALFSPSPPGSATHSTHQRAADLVPAAHGDGLSDNESGYRLEQVTTPGTRGDAVPVAFRVIGPDGLPRTGFRENQTKQLHLFAVRDDTHVFRHVHPTLVGDEWHTALDLPDGGAYRMFVEFVPHDTADPRHPVVLGVPFSVPGDTTLVPVPAPGAEAVTSGGFTVTRVDEPVTPTALRPQRLRFTVRAPDGEPVRALDPHLGAYGHMTGFHTVLLSATHLHPLEPLGVPLTGGELSFQAVFAERGEHRLFLEFSHGGSTHTAAVTVEVV